MPSSTAGVLEEEKARQGEARRGEASNASHRRSLAREAPRRRVLLLSSLLMKREKRAEERGVKYVYRNKTVDGILDISPLPAAGRRGSAFSWRGIN